MHCASLLAPADGVQALMKFWSRVYTILLCYDRATTLTDDKDDKAVDNLVRDFKLRLDTQLVALATWHQNGGQHFSLVRPNQTSAEKLSAMVHCFPNFAKTLSPMAKSNATPKTQLRDGLYLLSMLTPG